MRISDWSSDVCSSDLGDGHAPDVYGRLLRSGLTEGRSMAKLPSGELENQVLGVLWANGGALTPRDVHDALGAARGLADRKSVVKGKSVSERVDRGGRRIIKKKKQKEKSMNKRE